MDFIALRSQYVGLLGPSTYFQNITGLYFNAPRSITIIIMKLLVIITIIIKLIEMIIIMILLVRVLISFNRTLNLPQSPANSKHRFVKMSSFGLLSLGKDD